MADDWKPGDLALCVKQSPWLRQYEDGLIEPGFGPKPGSICEVAWAERVDVFDNEVALGLYGWSPLFEKFCASAFRKIHPHAPDAEDLETVNLLNALPQEGVAQ